MSSDGTTVAFLMHEQHGALELFVIEVSGTDPTGPARVNPQLDNLLGGRVSDSFSFSPDNRRLLYSTQLERNGRRGMYLTDLSGPTPGPTIALDPDPESFYGGAEIFSPDGQRLYGRGSVAPDFNTGLLMLDVSGDNTPTPVQVYEGPDSYLDIDKLCVAPDGTTLAFSQEVEHLVHHMFMADTAGASPYPVFQLHEDLDVDHSVPWYFAVCLFSDDGSAFVYTSSQVNEDGTDVFVVPVSEAVPGPAVRVSTNLSGSYGLRRTELVNQGRGVVYEWEADGPRGLHYADIRDPANPAPPVDVCRDCGRLGVDDFVVSPNGMELLVHAGLTSSNGARDLYLVRFAASGPEAPIKLNDDIADATYIYHAVFSPDQTRVVYKRRFESAPDVAPHPRGSASTRSTSTNPPPVPRYPSRTRGHWTTGAPALLRPATGCSTTRVPVTTTTSS